MYQRQENVRKIIGDMGRCFSGKLPSLMLQNSMNIFTKTRAMKDNLKNYYADFLQHAAVSYEEADHASASEAKNLAGGSAGSSNIVGKSNQGTEGNANNGESVIRDGKYFRDNYWDYRNNCKAFANKVVEKGGGDLPGDNGDRITLTGLNPISDTARIQYNGTAFTADDVKKLFEGAQRGDVVQMHWSSGGYNPHTAIIDSFNYDENGNMTGVNFLEANYGVDKIGVNPHSFTALATAYSGQDPSDGVKNGATIYRIAGFDLDKA
ncbi:MAG: hypothetical protein LBS53_06060 [Synergistaceae bacterium]|nr:hypothetical protein [Synergistaceae bacterium]